jgi:[ribosomal protein S5]-alanine N-acetyltransferase
MDTPIITERLILKNYRIQDLKNICLLMSEPSVWEFSDKDVVSDIEESKKHLESIIKNYNENGYGFQALFLKNFYEFIGEAGVISFNKMHKRAVIGYNLLPKYLNKGYATEITKALVKYLFLECKIERIEALVCNENWASKKVLEK